MFHLRQGLVAGYQAENLGHIVGTNGYLGRFNRLEFGVLTQNVARIHNDFGNSSGTAFGSPAHRFGGSYDNSDYSSAIEFSTSSLLEDESDVSSPPLWKTSPPVTPMLKASPIHHFPPPPITPAIRATPFSHFTPTSRSQAITTGRREMMEMIKHVPESAYELSLKDLIDLPTTKGVVHHMICGEDRGPTSAAIQAEKIKPTVKEKMKRKKNDKKLALRSGNMDSRAFLLKMFFPASLGSKKRCSSSSAIAKVMPKPQLMDGKKVESEKTVDGEWWKKKSPSRGESTSNGTSRSRSRSSSSSNGSRRDMGGFLPGCLSFFNNNKSKDGST